MFPSRGKKISMFNLRQWEGVRKSAPKISMKNPAKEGARV